MNFKEVNIEDLALRIVNIGLRCKWYWVNRIVLSSIFTRRITQLSQIIGKANNQLKRLCITNGFNYTSNEMIGQRMLWKDGLYLTDDDTKMSAGNFLNYLSIFWAGTDVDFTIDIHNSVNSILDCQSGKTKSSDIETYTDTAQKMKFSVKDFFSNCDQILNGKLHFLCSVRRPLIIR